MKKINSLLALTLFVLLLSIGCATKENANLKLESDDSINLDSYRINIGKTAFNSTNGVERGKIVDVEITKINGVEFVIYKINNGGRIVNAPASNITVNDIPSTVSKNPNPVADATKIDSKLENVASEFRGRLADYDGQILSLKLVDNRIDAEWISQKCDYLKPEITDLAISISRGYSNNIDAIEIKRTCDSTTKKFTISGSKFLQYKSGKIGDPEFLENIK